MLSKWFMSTQHVQYVLLLAVNSNQFLIFTELHTLTQTTHSYALLSIYYE